MDYFVYNVYIYDNMHIPRCVHALVGPHGLTGMLSLCGVLMC